MDGGVPMCAAISSGTYSTPSAAGHSVLEIRPSLTLEDVFFRHLESAPLDQQAGDRST
jgi:hypothetical protein